MKATDPVYTWQETVEGILVIGFTIVPAPAKPAPRPTPSVVPIGYPALARVDTDSTPKRRFFDEFQGRLAALGVEGNPKVAVVDFANSDVLNWVDDNDRATVSQVLQAHRRLKAVGGGLFICHHKNQFNPDLQSMFRMNQVISIHRTRQEALDAANAFQAKPGSIP